MSEPKRLRIIFDGTQVTETPDGWKGITSVIKRVKDLNSLFITTEAKLTFFSDGYDYLINKYETDGYCSTVEVDLQQYVNNRYQTFFKGIIFIRTIEIDRKNCSATVLVEDNTFYAKIFNNKSLEVFPFGEQTKSGLDILPCAYEAVSMFNPADGVYYGMFADPSNACYPVYNLFEYLISFMTDNTIAFESTLFGPGGDYEGLTVTCGLILRQCVTPGTTEAEFKAAFQKLSFKKLFTEVNKKVNIGMYVDYNGPLPILRIERTSAVRSSVTAFQAANIDELKESIDEDELYSSVRIGSSVTSDKAFLLFPENSSFIGPKEEQFITVSECNLDKELDLVSDFIISSNVIEDCVVQGDDSYDDEHFFIMCDVTGGSYSARQSTLDGQTGVFPVYYNIDLYGPAVMDNYFGAIPASIAQYLGNADNTFFATKTSTQTTNGGWGTYQLILFQDDSTSPNEDPGNNYDPVTSRYTIPTSGLYTFELVIDHYQYPLQGNIYPIEYYIERYDSGGGLLVRTLAGTMNSNGYATDTFSVAIPCDATDYVVATFFTLVNDVDVLIGSHFKCTNTIDGGGIYKTFEPEDYPVVMHEWEYPLTFNDFKDIAENHRGQIEYYRYNGKHYSGWIHSLKFKRFGDEIGKFITYRGHVLPETLNETSGEIRMVSMVSNIPDTPFTFSITDIYGQPFGATDTATKTYFFYVYTELTITIGLTFAGRDAGDIAGQSFVITRFTPTSTTAEVILAPDISHTLTIEPDTNYIIAVNYDSSQAGITMPALSTSVTAPVSVGANGTATILLVNPNNPADYTFLWSSGEVTASVNQPAGNYSCQVTYTPGTFDINTVTYNIQIPVSDTGV